MDLSAVSPWQPQPRHSRSVWFSFSPPIFFSQVFAVMIHDVTLGSCCLMFVRANNQPGNVQALLVISKAGALTFKRGGSSVWCAVYEGEEMG